MPKALEHIPLRIASRTDVGHRRKRNEDYLGSEQTPHGLLLVVCDGMGGHAGGDRASQLAVKVFIDEVKRGGGQPETVLRDAVAAANRAVFGESQSTPERSGMGTTLVGALVNGNVATVVNLGDSRAYHFSGRRLRRVTSDHSLVGEMVAEGTLSEHEARTHPQRNVITRALGLQPSVRPDVFHLELADGDALLLASDGLHGMIEDREIQEIIAGESVPEQACDRLVDAALDAGGDDNVTVVLLRAGELDAAAAGLVDSATVDPVRGSRSGVPGWLIIPVLALALVSAWYFLIRTPDVEPVPVAVDSTMRDSSMLADSSVMLLNDSSDQQTPLEMLNSGDSLRDTRDSQPVGRRPGDDTL